MWLYEQGHTHTYNGDVSLSSLIHQALISNVLTQTHSWLPSFFPPLFLAK